MPGDARLSPAQQQLEAGNAQLRAGAPERALKPLAEALRLQPAFPEAANSLGVALASMGQHQRAVACYRKAISLNPKDAGAHSNLGSSMHALGLDGQAVDSLRQALAYDPRLFEAHVNLTRPLLRLGRLEEAIRAAEAVLALRPDDTDALVMLGNALKEQGRYAEAAAAYRRVIALRPDHAGGYNNLGETLRDAGDVAGAAAAYDQAVKARIARPEAYSNLLYLHAFTHMDPERELQLAKGWEHALVPEAERQEARRAVSPNAGVFQPSPRAGRRLRIGILSAELGTHAVAEFLEPFLKHLDRERFHLTLFPLVGRFCPRAARFRALADTFVSLVGLRPEVAARRVRQESIDVLIETSGHTAGNGLEIVARRAAPVQCTYIGYWSTTGLTEMDWFLSDPDAPREVEAHFSESLWRLPRIAVCYGGDPALSAEDWTPESDGSIRLGSFNKYSKIREETLALWAEVLTAMPKARLVLEDRGLHEGESQRRICSALASHGISGRRVSFLPYEPGHDRHMRLYNTLDVALDTIPFNSGTTAFDALWMGVPLVALEGDWIGGRMAASVLRTLGRPEWIAKDTAHYISIVQHLAANIDLRRELRQNQRAQMLASPLCDAQGLTRALEVAFCGMYNRWLEGGS